MNNEADAIVLGGGIIGLYSALYLQSKGKNVVLIEGSDSLGGLLRSSRVRDGLTFDMGTHFINKTGIKNVDDILLDESILEFLNTIDEQKTSSITNGKLHSGSPFPNLCSLNPETSNKIEKEILSFKNSESELSKYLSLNDEFDKMFGTTANQYLFSPLYRKRFGVDSLNELSPSIGVIFGHRRVIAFDKEKTKLLKDSPRLDHRISHHGTETYSRKSSFLYPKSGGVQTWIDLLSGKFIKLGGKILKETFLSEITPEGNGWYLCTLSNDIKLRAKHLLSTIPPFLLAKALKFNFEKKSPPPKWTSTAIVNLELDQNYLSDSHYIVNHDPQYDFFRATLYENFNSRLPATNSKRITVEVILPETKNEKRMVEKTLNELKETNIIPQNTNILSSQVVSLDKGFPVFTSQMMRTSKELCSAIESEHQNIHILGRHNSGKWLMTENLSIACERLKLL